MTMPKYLNLRHAREHKTVKNFYSRANDTEIQNLRIPGVDLESSTAEGLYVKGG